MNVILVYHRIADDGWRYSVSPQHFAAHLEVLRREATLVRLGDLVRAPSSRDGRPRVALTFDDGYADNVTNGLPLLRRMGIPATFFVVSGMVGRTREFWWDELSWLLRDAYARGLRVGAMDSYEAAFDAFHEIMLDRDDPHAQLGILNDLAASIGARAPARREKLAMSRAQLQQLASDDLAEIGAHSVSHLRLSTCSPPTQAREISGSKRDLEAWLDRPVTAFSYPYGEATMETTRLVREAGFEVACTVESCPYGGQGPLRAPRMTPLDCDGEAFARRLAIVKSRRWPES